MGIKIFFGNYKGGVGKTTSSYYVARKLVELQKEKCKKALLIDLDPQSSLSEICMNTLKSTIDNIDAKETLNYVYSVYIQSMNFKDLNFILDSSNIIKTVKDSLVDFIPNSLFSKYGGLDAISIHMEDSPDKILILRNFIENNKLNEKYDYIIFDCPPSNNIITQSAFLYSDYYIIPTIMDELSTRGVRHYISTIENIYNKYCIRGEYSDIFTIIFGSKPELLGVFETMRKGPTDTEFYRNEMSKVGYLFDNEIKDRKDFSNSIGVGGIPEHDKEYTDLTKEILKRLSELNNCRGK